MAAGGRRGVSQPAERYGQNVIVLADAAVAGRRTSDPPLREIDSKMPGCPDEAVLTPLLEHGVPVPGEGSLRTTRSGGRA